VLPLQCDNDSQCQFPLKCMQRGGIEAVPGCSGEGVSGKDYCYSDGSTAPPISPPPTGNPTNVTPQPTNLPVSPPTTTGVVTYEAEVSGY